jgi:hypothetical protein
MQTAERNPDCVDVCISSIACGCGQQMAQDDGAAWTCFNELCGDRGKRYMPQVRMIEKIEEQKSA